MASPGASSRTGRSEAFRQGFEAAPQWEPVAPVRQRSPSPVYCIASPPISPSLPWSVPLQVQMPLIQQPVRMVQQVVQQVVQVPLQPIQSPVPNAARPVPVPQAMQGLPTVQATPSPSQCSMRSLPHLHHWHGEGTAPGTSWPGIATRGVVILAAAGWATRRPLEDLMSKARGFLKDFFGHDEYREEQEEALRVALNHQDRVFPPETL
eukprot:g18185.t1